MAKTYSRNENDEATTIEDVYKLDNELYDWWMRTIPR